MVSSVPGFERALRKPLVASKASEAGAEGEFAVRYGGGREVELGLTFVFVHGEITSLLRMIWLYDMEGWVNIFGKTICFAYSNGHWGIMLILHFLHFLFLSTKWI